LHPGEDRGQRHHEREDQQQPLEGAVVEDAVDGVPAHRGSPQPRLPAKRSDSGRASRTQVSPLHALTAPVMSLNTSRVEVYDSLTLVLAARRTIASQPGTL